ncbi:YppG family protein [Halobacillus sp. Cin3]|uniref:YppG family protein n=1 Tax=Halobacillus sp. Cin3 TaxID=2928441 RepID=UPI00248D875E|nr:YppG family protein [Halobacillus sp. Cin3]
MYPYYSYPYYENWYRYPAPPVYSQDTYPQTYYQGNAFYPYQGGAPYGFPYYQVNSNPYSGYTETGNEGGSTSFQPAAAGKSVIGYFQNEEGQFDFDKMMNTTGQVMKTVQQVSPIVKGIGTFVKGIK